MAFEYNGFVYRDLEPQVRYDAEQVQLLKQADVTINQNLQTVNTELDGKLTKPTNPSAESAVTMLADGTVGTKLLSEIGGGGKWYRHNVEINNINANANDSFHMSFLSRSKDSTTNITQIVTNEGFTEIVSLIGDIKITTDSAVTVFPLATSRGFFRGIIYSNIDNSTSVYSIHYTDLNVNNAGQGNVPANIKHVDTSIEI